jgi:hypothetical protein
MFAALRLSFPPAAAATRQIQSGFNAEQAGPGVARADGAARHAQE